VLVQPDKKIQTESFCAGIRQTQSILVHMSEEEADWLKTYHTVPQRVEKCVRK